MNARVLIIDDRAAPYAALVAATLAAKEVTDVWYDHDVTPEDTGLGFMEFFDWLAGTSDEELKLMHKKLCGGETYPAVALADPQLQSMARESIGLKVWNLL